MSFHTVRLHRYKRIVEEIPAREHTDITGKAWTSPAYKAIKDTPVAEEEWEIELTVDLETIANTIGPRAVRAKTGKSKFLHGLVVARRVRKVSETAIKEPSK